MSKNQRNINKKSLKIPINSWLNNKKPQRKLQRKLEKGQNSKVSPLKNVDRKLKKVKMKLRSKKKSHIKFWMKTSM